MLETVTAADFFGHKAHPSGRIFYAVLHDICHLERKAKTHIQLLQFRLAGWAYQLCIGSKQVGEQLSYNARHVVAVFVKVFHTLQRKPTGAEGSLLPKGKLRHALTHFHRHRPHRSGIPFGQFFQQGHYHMSVEAQVHVGVIRFMPAVGQRLLKGGHRLVRKRWRLENGRKKPKHNILARGRHLRVVFYGIGDAQVKVSKQNALVQASLEHVDIQGKRPRDLQQNIFGVLPSRPSVQDVLPYTDGIQYVRHST